MLNFTRLHKNGHEHRVNTGIINREHDEDLVLQLVDACKSWELIENLQFLDYEYISDARNIDMRNYITYSKIDVMTLPEHVSLHDTRAAEVIIRFKVTFPKKSYVMSKRFLIPIVDEDGYFLIDGKKSILIYQLVESSTYAKGDLVNLKSVMPLGIIRKKGKVTDVDKVTWETGMFNIYLFGKIGKMANIMLFFFAEFGATQALQYFGIQNVLKIVEINAVIPDEWVVFKINKNLKLAVYREAMKFTYVADIATSILDIFSSKTEESDLNNIEYWITRIGVVLSPTNPNMGYQNGKNRIKSFHRMVDEGMKKKLKLFGCNAADIYTIVRWMIQNYEKLRLKDDMNLANKRIRSNEYIVSLINLEFSKRLGRLIFDGDKVEEKQIEDLFKIPGDIIFRVLKNSKILRYIDNYNDLDIFKKLAYTAKGPNSLGSKNPNMMAVKYRGAHESHIGRFDINVCGSSDPGTSGTIVPFIEMDGLNFDASHEPEDGIREVEQFQLENKDSLKIKEPAIEIYHEFDDDYDKYLSQRSEMRKIANSMEVVKTTTVRIEMD